VSGKNFEEWIGMVSSWREATKAVPSMVRDDIVKSRLDLKKPTKGFKSDMFDPLAVQYAMGYKDRRFSLTYDTLRRIPQQLSIVAAILQTRCNQVASFGAPFRSSKSLGFVVKHKDPGRLTTKGEREFIKELESFIYNCGSADPNPHNQHIQRDDFETFLKKIVRDSLNFDQASFEVVCDRRGIPYEFMAVDASTIRIAAPSTGLGPNSTWDSRKVPDNRPGGTAYYDPPPFQPFKSMDLYKKGPQGKPAFVQLINGQIENVYTRDELAFGVRNPRTDIYIEGYGYGELEQLMTIVTSHLYAEDYNRRIFSQGSMPRGILNFRGDTMTPDQLEGFRRQWRSNLEGVENAFRTPILQTEQGIDWIDLHPTNRDMEYGQWLEYLLKVTCAVFLIDPAELNFDLHGGVSQTPLFEGSAEWKLKASRDRGLRPLLRFVAKLINKHIIDKIDDNFVFDFMGLDELTEMEKHELRKEQATSYMTLNEIRRAEDLPDVANGDIIMNPTYIQAMQVGAQIKAQKDQAEQQQRMLAGASGNMGQLADNEVDGAPDAGEEEDSAPAYADAFVKSLAVADPDGNNVLEVEMQIDEWLESIE
jgi:hypothetical protein